MRRVVIDTNIYIDWINERKHEEVIQAPGRVKHMSTVIMMELYAGASDKKDLKLLGALEKWKVPTGLDRR